MTEKKCSFCDTPAIREREIIANDLARAFPTNIPIVPGHVLVVPTRCVGILEDLTPQELNAILDLKLKLKSALTKTFHAEGFNYAWNEGELAGQSIPHFHLHMLPRKMGDTGITQYDPRLFLYRPGSREDSPESELLAVRDLIKQAL